MEMWHLQSKNRDLILITINCSLIKYPYPDSGLVQSRTVKETLWSIGKFPFSIFNAFPIVSSCSTDLCRDPEWPPGDKFCSLNLLCSPLESHWTFLLLLLLLRFSRVGLYVTPYMAAHQAPHPWDSPGKNTGVGCHFLLQCMKVKSESEVTQSCPTLATPWTAAYQAPWSMGFSRQEHWSGCHWLLQLDLPC